MCYNAFKSSNSNSKNEGSKTITQKPDNMLSIDKLVSDKAYEFVFDAKYKIDTTTQYQKSYGGIGAKEEGINTMHRYRDAIVYKNNKTGDYDNCVQSKRRFVGDAGITYYGKVIDIKIVKRNTIKEIPSDSQEDYYVFKIDEWRKLHRKIEVKGYQVVRVIYTTEYLRNFALKLKRNTDYGKSLRG